MNTLNILVLSDIHLQKMEANDQGLVLNELFKDLEQQLPISERENNWCLIAGDLVQTGIDLLYDSFTEKFLARLNTYVPKNQVLFTPGNHDFNREALSVNKEEHNALLSLDSENEANEKLEDNTYIERKFRPFIQFAKSKLNNSFDFDIRGYYAELTAEISVFALNSALTSSGGDLGFPNDQGNLIIDTSKLYEWIEKTEGRKRILFMHHPLSFLKDMYQSELEKIIQQHIDIFIFGHVHNEDFHIRTHPLKDSLKEILYLRSPQLYSSKEDLNGYSILRIVGNTIDMIFRQWSPRRRTFQKGADFANNEDGKYLYVPKSEEIADTIYKSLEDDLKEDLEIMGYTPAWEERILSREWCNRNSQLKPLFYHEVLNTQSNVLIASPANYGLTCYGRYLRMKMWEIKRQHWLWIDLADFKINQLEGKFGRLKNQWNIRLEEIKGIIVDNWTFNNTSAQLLLDKVRKSYPNIRLIVLGHSEQISSIEGMDCDERFKGFEHFYLNALPRKSMRSIVDDFTKSHHIRLNEIDESSIILDRLTMDLDDINMFRSPTNCIHMLFAFKEDFNERPVNRSRVFDKILKNLFNDSGLRYNGELTEEDCKLIMGALGYQLFRNKNHRFTKDQLESIVITTYKNRFSKNEIEKILQLLIDNKIIVEVANTYRFRAVFWEYYFTGFKMYQDENCFKEMVKGKNYLIPDIMEFYSGANPKCNEALDLLNEELVKLLHSVRDGLGFKPFNPYPNFKWNLNEHILGKSKDELDKEIKASRLPIHVKDDILDENYDQTRPFNQSIQLVMEEYDVLNLMFIVKSASRVLRNSTLAEEEKKIELFQNILLGWREIANVIMYLSPLLAKNGYGGVGGAKFQLTGEFPKEVEHCLRVILSAIPFNLIMWFKNDIYSDRLSYMFRDTVMDSSSEPITRHIAALLIADTRPQDWDTHIRHYISEMDKNSYYLGDLNATLQYNYGIATLNQSDEVKTRTLIKACIAKHQLGVKNPGIGSINKIEDEKLPPRLV